MIDIGSRTGHKLGILIVLTTLAIGNAAAVSWNSPDSNQHDSDVLLSVDAPESNIQNVTWEIEDPNGDVFTLTEDTVSGTNYSLSFDKTNDPADGTHGEYDFTAIVYEPNSEISRTSTKNLILDGSKPSVSFQTGEFVESDPTIEVEISDSYTDITALSGSITSGDAEIEESPNFSSCSSGNTCTVEYEIDTNDVDEGDSFNLEVEATDRVNNPRVSEKTFTLDTDYDGDSNPSFDVEDESDGVVVFDDDKDLTVDFGDADSASDTTVDCIVEGEDVDSFTVETGDGDEEYTCEIPEDDDEDYYDSSAEIYVEMEDEAGNTAESDSETVSFDVNPPTVTGLEIPSQAELYNTNFDVEFTAYDSASDVEEVEYYFDSDTSEGDGNNLDYDPDTDSYEIDTRDLGEGDQTLYIRAMDEADRWSSSKSVDFRFDPDAVPEISLAVPDSISVIAGSESSFDVTVENTGELHISSIELTGSAEGVFSDSQSISDLEAGESVTVSLDVNTESNNLGEHTVEVSTDNPSMSENLDMVVEANSDQQAQIDSDLSSYQGMLQEMESNVTDLRNKVSESKAQRLDSNFSTFKEKVQNAQSAVDNGDYYQAESILEGIDQDYSAAESSYETVKEEYENNQFWMLLVLGVGGFFVLGGGAIGAASYSDEVEFDVRDYLEKLKEMDFDLDLNTSALDGLTEKLSGVAEGKDTSSAENFEWEGFKDE